MATFPGRPVLAARIWRNCTFMADAPCFPPWSTNWRRLPGRLRPAEPGEFTRRAFENGKLDLTAAEGIADLVNADTEQQRRQALRQMEGALGRVYEGWRERLVRTLARLEAYIDFPEDDLPSELLQEVQRLAGGLAQEIGAHLADDRRGERLREGVSVAILGAPNSGKSSLLNYLAGRDAAIVSARAGTTRDVVEVRLDLGGYLVELADTAGLRDATDEIEAEGVERALRGRRQPTSTSSCSMAPICRKSTRER